nr:YfhO family protein [Actinomycetota bacterium]
AAQLLGGHPESSFYAVLATCAFLVLRLVQAGRDTTRPSGERRTGRSIAFFAGGMACGGMLAAVAIVPFAELLTQSADLSRGGVGPHSYVPRKYVLGLLLYDYWGRPTQTALEIFEFQRALYVGALPLMLAATALVRRRDLSRLAFAGVALFALLIAFGVPPLFQGLTALPAFHVLHNWRLAILFVLAVALLAGWGLDDLTSIRLTDRAAGLAVAIAATLVVVPVAWVAASHASSVRFLGRALDVAWGFAHPPPAASPDAGPIIRLSALILWVSFAVVALGLLTARLRMRLPATAFVALAVPLVAGDLFRAGMGENPATPVARVKQPVTGAIRYLQAQRPARFAGPAGVKGPPPIPPDVAVRYRLYDVRGYDFPVDGRYDRLWRRWVTGPDAFPTGPYLVKVNDTSLPVLNLLGVRDIIQKRGQLAPVGPGIRLAYDGPDAQIYHNSRALARAFVPSSQTVMAGDRAALEAVGRPDFDATRTLISDRRLPGLPVGGLAGGASGGTARISSYAPERVTVAVRATRRVELVLSDLSFPGWRATVDGEPARVDRVDYLLRGVPVAPGAHRVELRYEPGSWTVGWIVSLVGLVTLLGAVTIGVADTRLGRWPRPNTDARSD